MENPATENGVAVRGATWGYDFVWIIPGYSLLKALPEQISVYKEIAHPHCVRSIAMNILSEKRPTGSKTILVVADREEVRKDLCAQLAAQGYTCVDTCSGPEALAHLDDLLPADLLLIDLAHTALDGSHLLREIRQTRELLTLAIVMTEVGETSVVHAIQDDGADIYLVKPVAPDLLVSIVASMLGGYYPNQRPRGVPTLLALPDIYFGARALRLWEQTFYGVLAAEGGGSQGSTAALAQDLLGRQDYCL